MAEFIMKYWLEVLFGLIVLTLTREVKSHKATRAGVQALLRDRLVQAHNHYIELGCCSVHDRDNIVNMYNQYHNLGANGVVDVLIEKVLDLPVKNSC